MLRNMVAEILRVSEILRLSLGLKDTTEPILYMIFLFQASTKKENSMCSL